MAGESEVMMEEAERHETEALDLRSRAEEHEARARKLLSNLNRGMPFERVQLIDHHKNEALLLREEAEKHAHEAKMLRRKVVSGSFAGECEIGSDVLCDVTCDDAPRTEPHDPWAHRSQRMRCHTCMWFAPKGEGEIGRCRRHAPTITGYPVVFTADWCGDHKLNEEAIR